MTGAAQGIGKAVAIRFAREGGVVVLVDRSELVHEVREEIASSGPITRSRWIAPTFAAVRGIVHADSIA